MKSAESNLSASSKTICLHFEKSANFLWAKSTILPGVPTSICTTYLSLYMSSLKSVPPVDTIHSTFIYLPISIMTEETYNANSLVGTRIKDYI